MKRWIEMLRKWWRQTTTNRLDEDWSEMQQLSNAQLCQEFDKLVGNMNMQDRLRRCCYIMACRWWLEQREKRLEDEQTKPMASGL